MLRKINIVVITNLIFYFFIFLHRIVLKTYGDDYILQAIFYMALSFSTLVLEESYRKEIKKLKIISLIDFILRIIVLVVHFMYLVFNWDIYIVNLITGILFIFNIIFEVTIFNQCKKLPEGDLEGIKNKEIQEFIERFYNNEIDTLKVGAEVSKELKDIMKIMELSGKENLVAIFLFVLIFISEFIYKYFNRFIFFTIIVVSILLYLFVKLHTKIIKNVFKDEENINRKIIIENISFIIGYIILFLCEVIFKKKLSYMRVSVWVVSCVTFLPTLNRKYKIKERLKKIYKKTIS